MNVISGLRAFSISVFGMLCGPLSAGTIGVDECIVGTAGPTLTISDATQATCFAGDYLGSAGYVVSNTVFGINDWSLFGNIDTTPLYGEDGAFSDDLKEASDFDRDFDFTIEDDTAVNDFRSGQIFAMVSQFENVFVTLNSAEGFGAFLVSNQQSVWDWAASGEISSVSVWTQGSVSPVPLPAGALLLLSGLAMLGLRGKKASHITG